LSTVHLLDSFTLCQLYIKVYNPVLHGTALVWFPNDAPLWIKKCRNIECDIII